MSKHKRRGRKIEENKRIEEKARGRGGVNERVGESTTSYGN